VPALLTPWKNARRNVLSGLPIVVMIILLPLLFGDSLPSFRTVLLYIAVLAVLVAIELAVKEWLARRRLATQSAA
jgi:hypothetical protein